MHIKVSVIDDRRCIKTADGLYDYFINNDSYINILNI